MLTGGPGGAAAELMVRVGADLGSSIRDVHRVGQEVDSVNRKARAHAKQATETGRMVKTAFQVALGGAVAWGIGGAKNIETANVAFKHLVGGAQQGKKVVADLTQFAAQTPFEMPGIETAAQQLLNAGVSTKDLIPDLRALGNAASVTADPVEAFSGSALAMSQMLGKGKVSAEEMQQMVERGLPVWREGAKAMGMSVPELQKLISTGKLASDVFLPKLLAQMNKDYSGSMVEQSKTLAGVLSTLKDTVSIFLAGALQPMIPLLKAGAQFMSDNVTWLGPLAAGFLVVGAAGMTVSKSMQVARDASEGLKAASKALNLVMNANPYVRVALLIIAIGTALIYAYKHSETFRRIVQTVWNAVKLAVGSTVNFIISALKFWLDTQFNVVMGILHLMGKLPGPMGAPFRAAEQAVKNAKTTVDTQLDKIQARINRLTGKDVPIKLSGGAEALAMLRQIQAELRATPGLSVTARLNRGGTYQHGTMYVPVTGPALLHKGEIVVPPAQSERIRRGQAALAVRAGSTSYTPHYTPAGRGEGNVTFAPVFNINGAQDPRTVAAEIDARIDSAFEELLQLLRMRGV